MLEFCMNNGINPKITKINIVIIANNIFNLIVLGLKIKKEILFCFKNLYSIYHVFFVIDLMSKIFGSSVLFFLKKVKTIPNILIFSPILKSLVCLRI